MPEGIAIDRIESSKRKAQWVQASDQAAAHIPAIEAPKDKRSAEVDSLESLNEKNIAANQKKQQENSPGFWSTVWSKVCSLFGYSTAATTQAGQGSSSKPGGDGGQAVGASASLQAPFMFDLTEFLKLLKEARDSLFQIQQTNNDADEDLKKSEQSKTLLLEYLKTQQRVFDDGAKLIKIQYIRHNESLRDVRKKLGDTKTEAAESASNERYWGWWQSVATWTLVAATVALIGITVIPTAGFSLGAAAPALTAAMQIAPAIASAFSGVTTIMKGAMTQQTRDKLGAVQILSHKNQTFSQFKIPDDVAHMDRYLTQSLKIVTEQLKRLEEKAHNSIKSIISDIGPSR